MIWWTTPSDDPGSGISSLQDKNDHRSQRLVPAVIAAVAFIFLLLAMLISRTVSSSIREATGRTLQSVLAANVSALQMWFDEQQSIASQVAERESVQSAACELISKAEDDSQWDASEAMQEPAFEKLREELSDLDFISWCLLSPKHVVVASDLDGFIGQSLPIPDSVDHRLLQRQPTICRPIVSPVAIGAEGPLSIPGGPIMGAIAPISLKKKSKGSLMLLMDPKGRFSELLSVAHSGVSDETYAFDQQATLLSQSRFGDQLRAAAMLPEDPRVSSLLNVVIRDPGVNITTGGKPVVAPDQRPLTVMADQATRGGSGENLNGYNDYRGVKVIGAWTWLPNYNLGIATEIDAAEAYQPLRFLRLGLFVLLSATALTVVTSVSMATYYRNLSFRYEIGDQDGRRLGKYKLGELLGRGGMGSVYLGVHELLHRRVAIKVLTSEDSNSQAIARFEREVQMTASLNHPNTIDVFDYGRTKDGTFFYAMEHIDGITLQSLVEEYGAQEPSRVIHLLLQICGSLGEAHACGLIHRDVKPANILLIYKAGLSDWVKVLDFGLIKSVSAPPSDVTLTQSDTITGTPMYLSPECVRDAGLADRQSDLYSLGAVGYFLLTGQPIFDGTGSVDICMKQLSDDPIRPSKRLGRPLPEDLQNVLMSCLRKDSNERPATMEDLASALRSCENAGRWSELDAILWWEEVFSSQLNETGVGKSEERKTAIQTHRDTD